METHKHSSHTAVTRAWCTLSSAEQAGPAPDTNLCIAQPENLDPTQGFFYGRLLQSANRPGTPQPQGCLLCWDCRA